MLYTIEHSAFKEKVLAVKPAGWASSPQLFAGGRQLKKVKGAYKVWGDNDSEFTIKLKYNFLDPIPKVEINGVIIELATPLKWHEYIWACIPFLWIVSGGAIGAICGITAIISNFRVFRGKRSVLIKYLISGFYTLMSLIASVAIATAVIGNM